MLADFDAGNVSQAHSGTAFVAFHHDVFKFGDVGELAGDVDGGGEGLPGNCRQRADAARRDLPVLCGDGGGDVGGGQAVTAQFFRIEPNAHRGFGAELAHATDAGDALQFGDDVAHGVVARVFNGKPGAILDAKRDHHEEAGRRFGDGDAVLRNRGR